MAQAFQPVLAQAEACGYQKLPDDCDFYTNDHFLADTTKHENVSRKVAKIAKGELKNLAFLSSASLRLCVFASLREIIVFI